MLARTKVLVAIVASTLLTAVAPVAADDASMQLTPQMGTNASPDEFAVRASVVSPAVEVEAIEFTREETGETRRFEGEELATWPTNPEDAAARAVFELAPGAAATVTVTATLADGRELTDAVPGLNGPMPPPEGLSWTTNGAFAFYEWRAPEGWDEDLVHYEIHCPRASWCHAWWGSRNDPGFSEHSLPSHLTDGFAIRTAYPGAAEPSELTEFTWDHFEGFEPPAAGA